MNSKWVSFQIDSYLNVAPEPTMYFPSVLMTPAWPPPYWKTVTVPAVIARQLIRRVRGLGVLDKP